MHNISKGMVAMAVVAWCSFVGQCSFIESLIEDNASGKQTLKKLTSVDQTFLVLRLKSGTVYDFLEGSPQCNDESVYQGTNCVLRQHLFAIDNETLASVVATAEAYPEPPPDQYDLYSYEAIVRVLNVVESVGVTVMCRFAHLSLIMLAKPSYSPCEHFELLRQVLYAIGRKFKEHHIPLTPVTNLIGIFDKYFGKQNPDIEFKNNVKELFAFYVRKYGHLSGLADLSKYESVDFKTDVATLGKILDKNVGHALFFFCLTAFSSVQGQSLI